MTSNMTNDLKNDCDGHEKCLNEKKNMIREIDRPTDRQKDGRTDEAGYSVTRDLKSLTYRSLVLISYT